VRCFLFLQEWENHILDQVDAVHARHAAAVASHERHRGTAAHRRHVEAVRLLDADDHPVQHHARKRAAEGGDESGSGKEGDESERIAHDHVDRAHADLERGGRVDPLELVAAHEAEAERRRAEILAGLDDKMGEKMAAHIRELEALAKADGYVGGLGADGTGGGVVYDGGVSEFSGAVGVDADGGARRGQRGDEL